MTRRFSTFFKREDKPSTSYDYLILVMTLKTLAPNPELFCMEMAKQVDIIEDICIWLGIY